MTDQHSSAVVLGRLARRPVSGLTNSGTSSPAIGRPQTGLCLLRVHNSATWSVLPTADKHQRRGGGGGGRGEEEEREVGGGCKKGFSKTKRYSVTGPLKKTSERA